MYPPGYYPKPVPSFSDPVDIPSSGPFDSPLWQVCVNQEWLPYIAGSLKQLLLESTWRFSSQSDLLAVQGQVFDLISAFNQINEGCGSVVPTKMCISGTFADSDYSFVIDSLQPCLTVYSPGNGFQSCDDGSGNQIIAVGRTFPTSTIINSYSFSFPTGIFAGNEAVTVTWRLAGSVVRTDNYTLFPTNRKASSSTPVTADSVDIFASFSQTIPADAMTLTDWSMCYDGAFPLSVPPQFSDITFDVQSGYTYGAGPAIVTLDGSTEYRFDQLNQHPISLEYELQFFLTGCPRIIVDSYSGESNPSSGGVFWSADRACGGSVVFYTGTNIWVVGFTEHSTWFYVRSHTPFSVFLRFST